MVCMRMIISLILGKGIKMDEQRENDRLLSLENSEMKMKDIKVNFLGGTTFRYDDD